MSRPGEMPVAELIPRSTSSKLSACSFFMIFVRPCAKVAGGEDDFGCTVSCCPAVLGLRGTGVVLLLISPAPQELRVAKPMVVGPELDGQLGQEKRVNCFEEAAVTLTQGP